MADQAITALPKKTYSGSSQIASTDYLLGIDSAEGYQMLIQDLGEYIINRATASLAGSTQTLASAISALNSNISRSQIAQNSNLNSYTSGGSQRYYKGTGIGTMTNRPPEETNVNFPFALDVINVDGYDKQILHVYTPDGSIRMYERIQYYGNGNKVYASWFLKPAQTVVVGSNAITTTHTISSAVVLKIGRLVVANVDITATSDIAAWSNFFTIKNTNLASNVYGHLYTDGHTESALCSQYGQVQGSRAISNGSHALVTLVGVLSS